MPPAPPERPRLGVLTQSVWFEQAMRRRAWARNEHFTVQYLPWAHAPARGVRSRPLARPTPRWPLPAAAEGTGPVAHPLCTELSTGFSRGGVQVVDEGLGKASPAPGAAPACAEPVAAAAADASGFGWALGLVVPKRAARRAVTRNLLRREMRASLLAQLPGLPPGAWVMRLAKGFPRTEFPSASSPALRQAVRASLERLWASRDAGRALGAGRGG